MQVWQIILLSYFGALIAWILINAIFLLISFLIRRKFFVLLEGIAHILSALLGLATGIGDIILIFWLFANGNVFWAIIALILGISIISFIGELLAFPFLIATGLFSGWYDVISEK